MRQKYGAEVRVTFFVHGQLSEHSKNRLFRWHMYVWLLFICHTHTIQLQCSYTYIPHEVDCRSGALRSTLTFYSLVLFVQVLFTSHQDQCFHLD